MDEAAQVAVEALGSQYLYGGDFLDIVHRYCIVDPPEQCISKLQRYVDSGVKHIIFSPSCPMEDSARQMETIIKEIVPGLRKRVDLA